MGSVHTAQLERRGLAGKVAPAWNCSLSLSGGTIGLIFSRSGFTDPAQVLAGYMAPTTILLWEEAEIELALDIRKVSPFCRGLRWKYRRAVEDGLAFSDLSTFLNEAAP